MVTSFARKKYSDISIEFGKYWLTVDTKFGHLTGISCCSALIPAIVSSLVRSSITKKFENLRLFVLVIVVVLDDDGNMGYAECICNDRDNINLRFAWIDTLEILQNVVILCLDALVTRNNIRGNIV